MKRSETIIIESVLYQDLFGTNPSLAKEYGTTEITIQFPKKKKELVFLQARSSRCCPRPGLCPRRGYG